MLLAEDQGRRLLRLARAAVEEALGRPSGPSTGGAAEPWLSERGATFVTLSRSGELRGCIGSISADRPLGEDLRHNALAAACGDPRFPPLTRAELEEVRFEVSVLSPLTFLGRMGEAEASRRVQPGVHGVVIESGPQRGLFLPQMWEKLPDTASFFRHLRQKAGLPDEPWPAETRVSVFTVQKWEE